MLFIVSNNVLCFGTKVFLLSYFLLKIFDAPQLFLDLAFTVINCNVRFLPFIIELDLLSFELSMNLLRDSLFPDLLFEFVHLAGSLI